MTTTSVPSTTPSQSSSSPSVVVPTPAPTRFCLRNAVIDFETDSDEAAVNVGQYVDDDWVGRFGIDIRVVDPSTGRTRILDSLNPDGNTDLGSPNRYEMKTVQTLVLIRICDGIFSALAPIC